MSKFTLHGTISQ